MLDLVGKCQVTRVQIDHHPTRLETRNLSWIIAAVELGLY